VRPPYVNFYRAALGAVERQARAGSGGRMKFAQYNAIEARDFVDAMRQNRIEGWQGPAGGFIYTVIRNDAIDVVYGTMEGYAALGVPYMAHIAPTKKW
jgi:hypothetical protein